MPVGKNKSSKKSNAAIDDKPLETVPGTETETPAGNNGKAAESLQDADDTSGQYVTFFLQDESFAFPMADVREIVRVPTTVDVPLTSHTLVGLANLRGSVLPILDLRRLLIIDENDFTDATRVIVADCKGVAVGLNHRQGVVDVGSAVDVLACECAVLVLRQHLGAIMYEGGGFAAGGFL